MEILTKILSSLYFFNCLTSDPVPATSEDVSGIVEYERIVMVSKQNYSGASVDHTDPNHESMMATGVFSEAEIFGLDNELVADLKAQYGIDLNPETNPEVEVYPGGKRLLPGQALMVPVKYGDTEGQPWIITLDTVNPERAYKWQQHEYATIVVLQMDYTVPQGQGYSKEGTRITPNSIFYKGYVVHAKANQDMGLEENREVYKYSCTQLTPLQSNYLEELAYYSIIDSGHHEGLGISFTTAGINPPVNKNEVSQIEGRITLTWKKTN